MLKSIIGNSKDYDLFRELRGLENILARQDAKDSVNNPFATTSDEEWWLATAKKALTMDTDQLMDEITASIYSITKEISERYNNNEARDPGTEAPEGRQQQKDATPTTSEDELNPPGGTVRKRRNYLGEEISDGDGAGFKMHEIISPPLKDGNR